MTFQGCKLCGIPEESYTTKAERESRTNIVVLSLCKVQEHVRKCVNVRKNHCLPRCIYTLRIEISDICRSQARRRRAHRSVCGRVRRRGRGHSGGWREYGSRTQLRARKVSIWRSRSCRWGIDLEVDYGYGVLRYRYGGRISGVGGGYRSGGR